MRECRVLECMRGRVQSVWVNEGEGMHSAQMHERVGEVSLAHTATMTSAPNCCGPRASTASLDWHTQQVTSLIIICVNRLIIICVNRLTHVTPLTVISINSLNYNSSSRA
jgi:hypothetical protein